MWSSENYDQTYGCDKQKVVSDKHSSQYGLLYIITIY
jgi:hypothetical protein